MEYQVFYKNNLPKSYDVCLVSIFNSCVLVVPKINTVYKYACPMNHVGAQNIIKEYLKKDVNLSNLTKPIMVSKTPCKLLGVRIAEEFNKTLKRSLKSNSTIYNKLEVLSGYNNYKNMIEELEDFGEPTCL